MNFLQNGGLKICTHILSTQKGLDITIENYHEVTIYMSLDDLLSF